MPPAAYGTKIGGVDKVRSLASSCSSSNSVVC